MIILVPSYNRTNLLRFVISSILNSRIPQCLNERILILVVNNNPDSISIVDKIIDTIPLKPPFQLKVVHRSITMVAVESWFTALFDIACENEIVSIIGDDDFLIPSSISNIYLSFKDNSVDMLCTDYIQRVYFSDDVSQFVFLGDYSHDISAPYPILRPFNFIPDDVFPASFISSHSYRNNSILRDAYCKAIEWCKSQEYWAGWKFSSGLLPVWMSYAISYVGGKVSKLDSFNILRGCLISDVQKGLYSDGGSSSLYSMLYIDMLSKNSLHRDFQLNTLVLQHCKNSFPSNLPAVIFSGSIPFNMKYWFFRHYSSIVFSSIFTVSFIKSLFLLFVRSFYWLRCINIRNKIREHPISSRVFIKYLSGF